MKRLLETLFATWSADSAHWTYRYTDTWGMPARFDVMFDSSGKVTTTSELRTKY